MTAATHLGQKSAREAAEMIMSHQARAKVDAATARQDARRRRRDIGLRATAATLTAVTLTATLLVP